MAGAVGKDGRDADGHVYGFLRGKGRAAPGTDAESLLTPEEEGDGPMPAYPNDNDPEE